MSNNTDAPVPLSGAEIEDILLDFPEQIEEIKAVSSRDRVGYKDKELYLRETVLRALATLDQTRAELTAVNIERDYWKWIAEVAVVFIDHDAPESAKQALKEPEAMWRQWFSEGKTPFEAACAEMEAWDEG